MSKTTNHLKILKHEQHARQQLSRNMMPGMLLLNMDFAQNFSIESAKQVRFPRGPGDLG